MSLLPNVTGEELSKYTFTISEEGNRSKGWGELYTKTIADKDGYVSQIRNGIFKNTLSRGMIGAGSADVILKHMDNNGLITYHAIDIFRGDPNFTVTEEAGRQLVSTVNIDEDKLFTRGIKPFNKKYYKAGVNNN